MNRLNKQMTGKKDRPIKVVQFGEGNFLRAFVDYMIDIANEQGLFGGDIVLIKPIFFWLRGYVQGAGLPVHGIFERYRGRRSEGIKQTDYFCKRYRGLYG